VPGVLFGREHERHHPAPAAVQRNPDDRAV
jgi:hypothetical protein